MLEQLLTLDQVAEYLNVDKFTIYRLLAQKMLPAFKVGGQWRFKRNVLDAWLENKSNIQRNVQKSFKSAAQTEDESFKTDQVKIKKALIVEDHPDMLEVLTLQMEILGFAVIVAKNGKEGVEKAITEKPDLILMDIMMPGMDGREATRIIRSNADTHDIPILAATALFLVSDLESCIEAGCNDFLVKPITKQQLQRKIQTFIPTINSTTQ